MDKDTIFNKIINLIGNLAFKIFLWSIKMTKDEYFKVIYQQEKECELTKVLRKLTSSDYLL